MFGLGLLELLVILIIVLLFFGTKRLPLLSKNLGKSARELRNGFTDGKNDKSLTDIAKEVKSSAHEIKKGVDSVKNTRI
jgi:sec-independent protein translocase protein TatA